MIERNCRDTIIKTMPKEHIVRRFLEALGDEPDAEIARRFRTSVTSVRVLRKSLGVPPSEKAAAPITHAEWDQFAPLLGTEPDREIAKRIRKTVAQVRRERINRGIQSFHAKNQKPWAEFHKRFEGPAHRAVSEQDRESLVFDMREWGAPLSWIWEFLPHTNRTLNRMIERERERRNATR